MMSATKGGRGLFEHSRIIAARNIYHTCIYSPLLVLLLLAAPPLPPKPSGPQQFSAKHISCLFDPYPNTFSKNI